LGPARRGTRMSHVDPRLRWRAPARVDSRRSPRRLRHHPRHRCCDRGMACVAEERRTMKFSRRSVLGVLVATVALVVAGCSGAGSLTGGGGREITVAMVSNSQMQDAVALS